MHRDPRAPAPVSRHVSPCAAPVLLPPRVAVPRGEGGDEVPRPGDSQDQGAAHRDLRGHPRAEVSWPEEPVLCPCLTTADCAQVLDGDGAGAAAGGGGGVPGGAQGGVHHPAQAALPPAIRAALRAVAAALAQARNLRLLRNYCDVCVISSL